MEKVSQKIESLKEDLSCILGIIPTLDPASQEEIDGWFGPPAGNTFLKEFWYDQADKLAVEIIKMESL